MIESADIREETDMIVDPPVLAVSVDNTRYKSDLLGKLSTNAGRTRNPQVLGFSLELSTFCKGDSRRVQHSRSHHQRRSFCQMDTIYHLPILLAMPGVHKVVALSIAIVNFSTPFRKIPLAYPTHTEDFQLIPDLNNSPRV